MEREIPINRLFKILRCLMCVLLLLLLAMNTVSALDCDDPADETENLICQIKTHLPEPDDPRLDELKNLPTIKWCTHCHEGKDVHP
jgi:hypothetical protein